MKKTHDTGSDTSPGYTEPTIISTPDHISPASDQVAEPSPCKPSSKRNAVSLSRADLTMLQELQGRCDAVGIKIKKKQLLVAGLRLFASIPMGKFLAVLGPMESPKTLLKRKKRMTPPRG